MFQALPEQPDLLRELVQPTSDYRPRRRIRCAHKGAHRPGYNIELQLIASRPPSRLNSHRVRPRCNRKPRGFAPSCRSNLHAIDIDPIADGGTHENPSGASDLNCGPRGRCSGVHVAIISPSDPGEPAPERRNRTAGCPSPVRRPDAHARKGTDGPIDDAAPGGLVTAMM